MMTKQQREAKKQIEESSGPGAVYADKITCRATGEVEVRHGYFYHNRQADAARQRNLEAMFPGVQIDQDDEFRAWPKDSYWVHIIRFDLQREATA